MDLNFSFLRLDQIIGEKRLSIFKKMSADALATDFARLLGDARFLEWWTRTPAVYGPEIYCGNNRHRCTANWNLGVGGRPVLKYSSVKHMCKNSTINDYGVTEVEFGEYPKTECEDEDNELSYCFSSGTSFTDKSYTIANARNDNSGRIDSTSYQEFEYKGNRYIPIESSSLGGKKTLTNGKEIKPYRRYFLKVEPIVWLVDEEADIMISKDVVFAGVMFHPVSGYYEYENFETTNIKNFMDNNFANDIKTSEMIECEKYNHHILMKS